MTVARAAGLSAFLAMTVLLTLHFAGTTAAPAATGPAATEVARAAGLTAPTLFLPGLSRDGEPATASLSTRTVYQGGALRLTVFAARSASAAFLGYSVDLPEVGGRLSTYLGVPPEAPAGEAVVEVTAVDLAGLETVLRLPVTILETAWTVDYIQLPPGVGEGLTPEIIQAEADRLAAIYEEVTAPVWDAPWMWPLDPETPVSGYFGEQRSFNGGPPTGHHGGTDFAAAAGDPVWATNGGTVVLAEKLAVRGWTVIIDHGGGIHSAYAHLQSIAVSAGQPVQPGQIVGRVGTTGLSTGPHLHWELAVHGILVDGLRWLDGSQGF